MSNFNQIRDVNLIDYLPNIFKNSLEMKEIMSIENPFLEAIWQACEDCIDDQFIIEATENGIARREKMLNIDTYSTDSLEDRRFRLLAKYNENIPYTRRTLDALLESLCGAGGYTLEFLTNEFTVKIELALSERSQSDIVKETLERILPYNMGISVEILYFTWSKYNDKTWDDVSKFTWSQLLGEEGEIYV